MSIARFLSTLDLRGVGERMHALIAELYPICRSITGDGLRETMRRIATRIPLQSQEVPTVRASFPWGGNKLGI